MIRFYAEKFTTILAFMAKASEQNLSAFELKGKTDFDEKLKELKDICESIGLEFSARQIARIRGAIAAGNETDPLEYANFTKFYNELEIRIFDELTIRACMIVSRSKADYYEKANLFGDNVFNKFPSANFDIDEAGKCFALARDTACVMHLQRVLEVGLKSYGNFLGIPSLAVSSQPSWNKVLDQTRKEIKERDEKLITAKVWTSNEEKEFCEGVQPFLEAIKIAWRNPTMHVDKKYTEEEAEDIFSSVKGLMRHLAKHLDESGTFTP